MSDQSKKKSQLSRRALLKNVGLAPLLLRPAPFWGASILSGFSSVSSGPQPAFQFADIRFKPHYPAQSSLADILRLVPPGADEYLTEKYSSEIDLLLKQWGNSLKSSVHDQSSLANLIFITIEASSLTPDKEVPLRAGFGIDVTKRHFGSAASRSREQFLEELQAWLGPVSKIEVAEFEIYGIKETSSGPLTVELQIRYDMVAIRNDTRREERVGSLQTEWVRDKSDAWKVRKWILGDETQSVGNGTAFVDVTSQALGATESYNSQMLRGVDYWRTTLDGASGIDIYSNNGVAAGDYDNDGFDDFYVCQPAGLPNRLYRNRGDGTFEDVTEKAGVAVLDNTACALFADFENRGFQDLLVVCGSGPLLFVNQRDGTFIRKHDAFKFARVPEGTFTHAAIADYDGDGRLDIYFCTYMYYLGLDQYHYPVPYYDARNVG